MKFFLYNCILFTIIILFFNGIIYTFANKNYYNGYEKYPDKKYCSFILSDSHGLPMGNFSEEFNVFNFSADSDSYFDMKRKIQFLLDNNYCINKIFLTVDDHTISPYREKTNNLDRSSIYESMNEYKNYYQYLKEKYIKYYFPIFQPKISLIFKSYLKAKLRAKNQSEVVASNVKAWSQLPEIERIKRSEDRKKSQFPEDNESINLKETLLEIIYLCQLNDIELIGIKFPLSSTYLKVLDNKSYRADEVLKSRGLKVIDLKEIFIENPEYFANEDHLNSTGGKIFTNYLLKE